MRRKNWLFDSVAKSERRFVFVTFFIGFFLFTSHWRISSRAGSGNSNTSTIAFFAPFEVFEDDAAKLIDLNHFEYLINQDACDSNTSNYQKNDEATSNQPIVLILVHSAPANWQKRNVIRETWGRQNPRARTYFLLGAVNISLLQAEIEHENSVFKDLIQGNFIDHYRNMTYKHVMAFKWMVQNCANVKYLLKTDDDVFVNTPAVYNFLGGRSASNSNDYLLCAFKYENPLVKRSYRSKWRVGTKEYPGRYYPDYCPGFSLIYSIDVVIRLYKAAQQTHYFWIDDMHVTGTLAQKINANIVTSGKHYMNENQLNSIFNGDSQLADVTPTFLFTVPNIEEKDIRKLWQLVFGANNKAVNTVKV